MSIVRRESGVNPERVHRLRGLLASVGVIVSGPLAFMALQGAHPELILYGVTGYMGALMTTAAFLIRPRLSSRVDREPIDPSDAIVTARGPQVLHLSEPDEPQPYEGLTVRAAQFWLNVATDRLPPEVGPFREVLAELWESRETAGALRDDNLELAAKLLHRGRADPPASDELVRARVLALKCLDSVNRATWTLAEGADTLRRIAHQLETSRLVLEALPFLARLDEKGSAEAVRLFEQGTHTITELATRAAKQKPPEIDQWMSLFQLFGVETTRPHSVPSEAVIAAALALLRLLMGQSPQIAGTIGVGSGEGLDRQALISLQLKLPTS